VTTRPKLRLGSHLLPGLVAVALFVVFAAVFLTSSFEAPAGFPAGASITATIGYALIDLQRLGSVPTEGFLVAFIVIAIALDAALDGAVMLAKTEDEGRIAGALRFVSPDREADDAESETDAEAATRADGGRDVVKGDER
jgi:NADH-quinone oxidoreductase subunit J